MRGKKLSDSGFNPGTKYEIYPIDTGLKIALEANGRYTVDTRVTKTGVTPVFELLEQQSSALFTEQEVILFFFKNEITAHVAKGKLTLAEDEELTSLGRQQKWAVWIPTSTGFNKGFSDSTGELRELLAHEGIHDYELQERGKEFRVNVPALLGPDVSDHTDFGMYRSNTEGTNLSKKNHRRITIHAPDLRAFCKPADALGISVEKNDANDPILRIINLSQGTGSGSNKSSSLNPKWSREELILALDVYLDYGLIDETHVALRALSDVLRSRADLDSMPSSMKYRNRNGVKMKLANLARLDPAYEGIGLKAGGKLEQEIWFEFAGDRERLSEVASKLRDGINHDSTIVENDRTVSRAEVEQIRTPEYSVIGSSDVKIATRREQKLVIKFKNFLESRGHRTTQHVYGNGSSAMRCDLFDETQGVLVEAKGTSHRMNIRLAIGQLLDYRRFEQTEPMLAILVPFRPTAEMVDLCSELDIEMVWTMGDGFESSRSYLLDSTALGQSSYLALDE